LLMKGFHETSVSNMSDSGYIFPCRNARCLW